MQGQRYSSVVDLAHVLKALDLFDCPSTTKKKGGGNKTFALFMKFGINSTRNSPYMCVQYLLKVYLLLIP